MAALRELLVAVLGVLLIGVLLGALASPAACSSFSSDSSASCHPGANGSSGLPRPRVEAGLILSRKERVVTLGEIPPSLAAGATAAPEKGTPILSRDPASPNPLHSSTTEPYRDLQSRDEVVTSGTASTTPRWTPDDSAGTTRFSSRAVIVTSRMGRVLRTIRTTRAPAAQRAVEPREAHQTAHPDVLTTQEPLQELGLQRGLAEPPPEVAVIEFQDIPAGDPYQLNSLDISGGHLLFSYLSEFFSYVQPNDFPIDLLRDFMNKRMSFSSLVLQALQLEAGFLSVSAVFVLLALAAPCVCLSLACAGICRSEQEDCSGIKRSDRRRSTSPTEMPPTSPPPPPADIAETLEGRDPCRRRTLITTLVGTLLLLGLSVSGQVATNQQVSVAVASAPVVLQAAVGDLTVFVRNARLQIHALVTNAFRQAAERCKHDLDHVDELLGRPLQRELAAETGLDVALDALLDVASVSQVISGKVSQLLEAAAGARDAAGQVQERLQELRAHLDAMKRSCPRQERPLCDTLHSTGMDVTLNLDAVLSDEHLSELRSLGGQGSRNFSALVDRARTDFQTVPELVARHTARARQSVREALDERLLSLESLLKPLDGISARLAEDLDAARSKALELTEHAQEADAWRWTASVGASLLVVLPATLLLGGSLCLCCGARERAGPPLLASVVLAGLVSAPLWLAALAVLLAAGHADVFVCRPLSAGPDYTALSRLLDSTVLPAVLYPNQSVQLHIKDVIRGCRLDGGAYSVLGLRAAADLEIAAEPSSWAELEGELEQLRPNLAHLQLLTPGLQGDLRALLDAAMANMTAHRLQLQVQGSAGVTAKDLAALADQMESVANQIGDVATASRVETLATRTRRVQAAHVQPLLARKENLIYQLTTLEVELAPLQRQVNQSLSHLKTIQYFIDKQGATMAGQMASQFRARVTGYLQQARDHVMLGLRVRAARCGPVWSCFHALSTVFCRHALDPLNGLWASLTLSLLLLLVATPPALHLSRCGSRGRARQGARAPSLGVRWQMAPPEYGAETTPPLPPPLQGPPALRQNCITDGPSAQGSRGSWLSPGTMPPDGW